MKNFLLLICLLAITSVNYSQVTSVRSEVIFLPAKPTVGDSIHVLFIPGIESELFKSDTVYMQVQFYPIEKKYYIDEFLMRKTIKGWEAAFKLEQKDIGCMVFQFAFRDSMWIDNNEYKAWDLLVYTKDGVPVKGAHSARAGSYISALAMQRKQNMDIYESELAEELRAFPSDPHNLTNTWWIRLRNSSNPDSIISIINKEIDSLTVRYPTDIKIFSSACSFYNQIRNKEKADKMLNKLKLFDPNNSEELWNQRGKYFFSNDSDKKLQVYFNILSQCKDSVLYDWIQRDIFQTFKTAGYYEQAIKFLKEWRKPDLVEVTTLPSHILYTLDKKINQKFTPIDLKSTIKFSDEENQIVKQLFQAKTIAEEAIKMYEKQTLLDKEPTITPTMWESQRKRMIGCGYANIAHINYLLKNLNDVESNYIKAKELLGESAFSYLCTPYVRFLIERKRYKEAFNLAYKSLRQNSPDKTQKQELEKLLLLAESNLPLNQNNVDVLINELKKKELASREEEIKRNFKKEFTTAVDFALTDLNGKTYSLTSLHGKIVIIDFWNTYCGWCLRSFEYIQKYYNSQRNNKNVVVLSINCNPHTDESERIELVKSFIKETNYSFPVLIDKENKIADKYGIYAVPAMVMIGPNGKIYYKEFGFPGSTMYDDIIKIVDMIKTESKAKN